MHLDPVRIKRKASRRFWKVIGNSLENASNRTRPYCRHCEERSGEASSSFRDGALHQTSDVQLHIGESLDSGLDAEPVIGPARGRTRWHRPGMTVSSKLENQRVH